MSEKEDYERIMGIFRRDMYDILEKMKKPDSPDLMETLHKMTSHVMESETVLGQKLEKITYDKKKNKFDFNFRKE